MRLFPRLVVRPLVLNGAAALLALTAFATVADAKCQKLGYSVNDYGKDGPTKDAKALLDTFIAKWATENKVKAYTTGKKDVTCELFLDVGLFDEYTCKASANVCWGEGSTKAAATSAAVAPAAPAKKPKI